MASFSIRRLFLICFMIALVWLVTTLLDTTAIVPATINDGGGVPSCACDAWPFPWTSSEGRSRLEVYTHSHDLGSVNIPEDTVAYVELVPRYTAQTISGGTVRINGFVIQQQRVYGNIVYHGRLPFPIHFNKVFNVFSVEGSKGFPALADSVRSFKSQTHIAYPLAEDTVSRSRDLVIRWNPELRGHPEDRADVVNIYIREDLPTSGSKSIRKTLTGDPGQCTVTRRELSALKPGPIWVTVARANENFGRIDESRTYEMLVGSMADVYTTLAR